MTQPLLFAPAPHALALDQKHSHAASATRVKITLDHSRAGPRAFPFVLDHSAHSVCSPPPCGEGLGVGVRQRITARPPPRRFAIADAKHRRSSRLRTAAEGRLW